MSKAVKKVDVDIQTIEQLVEQIGSELSIAWHELDGNKKAQAALGIAMDKVNQLAYMNSELDALLKGAEAAVVEMGRQRDLAIHDSRTWKRYGTRLALHAMSGKMAIMGGIGLPDVLRVFNAIAGIEPMPQTAGFKRLVEGIQAYGDELFEEEVFDAASREVETED